MWLQHRDAMSPYFWALVAGWQAIFLYGSLVIDPGLAQERFRPARRGLDDRLLLAVRLAAVVALWFGILDGERYHWSASMPGPLRAAGIGIYLAGIAVAVCAMSFNRFFSPKIRLQDERGHHVIDRGPYAIVRHPGYAGMVVCCAAIPLALNSWWTCVVMLPCMVFFLRRVGVEDRFLHERLPGYRAYAARVRYRLMPLVW